MSAPLSAERLFRRHFLPLYPNGEQTDLAAVRTADANTGNNPHIVAQLAGIARTFGEMGPAALGAPELVLDGTDASVHALSAELTRERRASLLSGHAEGEPAALVPFVIHGAVYVGQCAVDHHGGRWEVRNPLWESRVAITSRAGEASLAVFQWWLKALSDDEIDSPMTLADRYFLHVEVPTAAPEELPPIAPPDRKLPRLRKVRYDTLHQYLRAHLPELRGVGDHFPEPQRLTELGFNWLDFTLLGGGRMLLMHGPTNTGVHLMWLDASGFSSSVFYPADATPEHTLSVQGDRLRLRVPVLGADQEHELLWWGPSVLP